MTKRIKGLRLAARAIQRQHQMPTQALPQRMLGNERVELPGQLRVPPDGQFGLDALLEGDKTQLAQTGDG
jgi:hypothetical protein